MRSVDLHPTRRVAIRNRAATVVLMIGFAVVGTGAGVRPARVIPAPRSASQAMVLVAPQAQPAGPVVR